MAGFEPMRALWEPPGAPYPSEMAARWALRQHREKLVAASALAVHRGRIQVHLQRFSQVMERAAIDQAAKALAHHAQH